eukprot:CAMPEP_0113818740 /NCGR_PEP_ID=MMETSP0328-20130328/391_1 /TAXON_ID=39455 /ORGANISM="Alexandrium minutum" /LENGTH=614 /DNA_ID=CAMNT_0000786675 /DNA_START=9 /DNA_END=1849 /DNA_ORIENTATION=+ /assembly_acc=CAM_ASM_000350
MSLSTSRSFPDVQDNRAALQAWFAFQGYIDDTAHRGISLLQLQRIVSFIRATSSSWYDTAPPSVSKFSGKHVPEDKLNLYHFNTWAILPATKEKDCAFIELLSGTPQVPSWFASHWWGEAIKDFVACVARHVEVRRLSPDKSFIWVCAYANRQHSLQNELVEDPKQTSFFRAMRCAIGVLLILDHDATAFSRIWCGFEESVALTDEDREAPMLLDIATSHGGKVTVIADGIAEIDRVHHFRLFGNMFGRVGDRVPLVAQRWVGPWNKSRREKEFPAHILAAGFNYRVESGKASMAVDRSRILNSIAGRPLNDEPLTEHSSFRKVNSKLSSAFALAAWRQLAERGVADQFDLPGVLKADESLRSVVLDFKGVTSMDDAAVGAIAAGLPASVRILDLAFIHSPNALKNAGGRITDMGAIPLAQRLPQELHQLSLDFSTNDLITDKALFALAASLAESLQGLFLRFNGCTRITGAGFKAVMERLPSTLKVLELGFTGCDGIADDGFIALGSAFPAGLQDVVINMNNCLSMTDMGLREMMRGMPVGVKQLSLFLTLNRGISDVGVSAAWEHLPSSLKELWVMLGCCPRVTEQSYLALADALPSTVEVLGVSSPIYPLR